MVRYRLCLSFTACGTYLEGQIKHIRLLANFSALCKIFLIAPLISYNVRISLDLMTWFALVIRNTANQIFNKNNCSLKAIQLRQLKIPKFCNMLKQFPISVNKQSTKIIECITIAYHRCSLHSQNVLTVLIILKIRLKNV